ncbi:amino acid adenylation domain-containing protein [Dactylosporangium sp. CS-047395]|uniref:non-ribosomal peptide synthetase/MFS transporter n=1 Tax=Dactylosporangium sp. CS-047395 TaxID=3239936 RepID=UPI003D9307ED
MTVDDTRQALLAQRLRRRTVTRTVPNRPAGTVPPLSFAQERLWFMEQYAPGNRAYLVPVARRIRRAIDADRLAAALRTVVGRHEALRTRFPARDDGVPTLEVDEEPAVALDVVEVDGEDAARVAVEALHARGFDLAREQPLRAVLVRLAPDDAILALTVHHIAIDGWSVPLLLGELMTAYDGGALPDLPVQYGDYAAWQRDRPAPDIARWARRLDGVEPLALPTDRPRPPELTYDGGSIEFAIDAELANGIRALADNHGASLYMTMLAAYAALLGRHAHQTDLTIGSPVAGRGAPELEHVIGCFVNTLVMRVDLSGDPTFTDLLLRVRETALNGLAEADTPFEQVVAELNLSRDVSRSPLFQALLAVQNYGSGGTGDGLDGYEIRAWATRYDLELYVSDSAGGGLWGQCIFSSALFDAATVHRLIERLVALLRGAVADPLSPVAALDLRDDEERAAAAGWNATAAPFDTDATLPGLFAAQVAATPDAPAVTFEDATWSYAELDRYAGRVAAALRAIGAGPGTRIGVCAPRSLQLPGALLGVMRTGAAYVPLDPDYPEERLAFMAADAGLLTVLTLDEDLPAEPAELAEPAASPRSPKSPRSPGSPGSPTSLTSPALAMSPASPMSAAPPTSPMSDASPASAASPTSPASAGTLASPASAGTLASPASAGSLASAGWLASAETAESAETQPVTVSAGDTAYVIYTSGSTGRPKGVPNGHRGVVNRLTWMQERFRLGPGDVVLQKTPAGFDVSVWEFFWPLITGARLVLAKPGGHRDAAYLRALMDREAVTVAHFVPSMLAVFLAEETPYGGAALRAIVCSGEELPADLARRCLAAFPAELHNLYGPTEAAIDVSAWHVTAEALGDAHRVPIGGPVANTTLHVLDERLRPQPVGVPGELHIGGVQVAEGYLGRPRLTAERFIPDPFGPPGSRLYRTGDLARRRPDGTLEFLGRIDGQVKLRGQRIELGEIEAVLREQPGVRDAAVVVREDRPGDQRLVAYVVGETPDRAALKRILPDYMIPAAIVPLGALPLSANGKLDRRALPAPVRAAGGGTAPATPTERLVADIWAAVLELRSVGAEDDFFDLGGHSLLATQVAARLRKAGAAVGVVDLFQHKTVRELAALIDRPSTEPRSLVRRLTPDRPTDLSLVCVPFGGGSAVVYQPVADALPAHCALWSVAIPGHDVGVIEDRLDFAALIDRCVDEILANIRGPLSLYGHCGVGSALAVALARRLEAAGREVRTVYIGAMFPFAEPRGRLARALSRIARMEGLRGDRVYHNWLTSIGADLGGLDPDEARHIVRNLRRDSVDAERYYTEMYAAGAERLRAKFVTIVGTRDPATEFYEERFREWHFLSDDSAVVVLKEAGHFFLKYRAAEIAAIIDADLFADDGPSAAGWYRHAVSHGREVRTGPQPSLGRFATVSAGQLASMLGSALTEFAIPVWIYLTTGSVAQFALFAVLGLVPGLLTLPIAGAIVDRYDRRRIVLAGDLAAGGVQGVLAALLWTGHLSVGVLYPATVALSIALAFQRIAYTSAIPQLVPKRLLGHAAGIGQLGAGLAQLLAPLLGAGLLATIGLRGILTLDVASYLIAVAIVLAVRFPSTMPWRRHETLRAEIAGGFRYVWGNRNFRRMLLWFAVLNIPLSAVFLMLSPLVLSFATLRQVGQISFVSALGVFLGGLIMAAWGGPRHRRMFGVLLATLALAACALLTGLRENLILIGAGALGMALALTLLNGVYTTIIQVKVPQRLHGRVFSLNTLIAWSTMPLGFGIVAPFGAELFRPLLHDGAPLADALGPIFGTGPNRGLGLMFAAFALAIAVIALAGLRVLRRFDDEVADGLADDLVGLAVLESPTATDDGLDAAALAIRSAS